MKINDFRGDLTDVSAEGGTDDGEQCELQQWKSQ